MDRRAKNQPINYQNIVKKYAPENIRFTINKNYVTPDDRYIP